LIVNVSSTPVRRPGFWSFSEALDHWPPVTRVWLPRRSKGVVNLPSTIVFRISGERGFLSKANVRGFSV
jgi:hypothetical protein